MSDTIALKPAEDLRDLGVVVTPDLSWSSHIGNIVKKARAMSSWVLSVFRTREANTMLTLYKAFVRSNLEYCSPIWHPTKISEIEIVEGVQREFTKRIADCSNITYWERLKKLKLMSLQRRRERFIILTMWKILHGEIPNEVNVRFRPQARLGVQAIVPSLSRNCGMANQSLYDASFAVVG